jgi:hypothetical protein
VADSATTRAAAAVPRAGRAAIGSRGLELELNGPAVERVQVGREQVDERVGVVRAVERERHSGRLSGQLVDGHDRRVVPVAAVGKGRRRAGVEDLERSEAELGTLALAPDEPLEPVQQRPARPVSRDGP